MFKDASMIFFYSAFEHFRRNEVFIGVIMTSKSR